MPAPFWPPRTAGSGPATPAGAGPSGFAVILAAMVLLLPAALLAWLASAAVLRWSGLSRWRLGAAATVNGPLARRDRSPAALSGPPAG
jgi:hypothetical protein